MVLSLDVKTFRMTSILRNLVQQGPDQKIIPIQGEKEEVFNLRSEKEMCDFHQLKDNLLVLFYKSGLFELVDLKSGNKLKGVQIGQNITILQTLHVAESDKLCCVF